MSKKSQDFGKYLYLGCGNHRMEKFTHVDLNIGKNKSGFPDIFCDISNHIPLPNNHVKLIFSRGTMEHLKYAELINCLLENYRILKKGGVVRMLVPDFDIMIKKYLNKKSEDKQKKEMARWNMYERMPTNGVSETFINSVLYHDHYYLHNFDTLYKALYKCGFVNIRRVSPGETLVNEISDILKEAEVGRTDDEILIEAEKGDIPSSLKILNRPMPKNLIAKFFAKFFNIRITAFVKRQAFFPQKRWFLEKKIKVQHFLIKKKEN